MSPGLEIVALLGVALVSCGGMRRAIGFGLIGAVVVVLIVRALT